MTSKSDANTRLETIVSLSEAIIEKARAAQAALPELYPDNEPAERNPE